jgi:hypothetical protein
MVDVSGAGSVQYGLLSRHIWIGAFVVVLAFHGVNRALLLSN